jgi:hypothetical protein
MFFISFECGCYQYRYADRCALFANCLPNLSLLPSKAIDFSLLFSLLGLHVSCPSWRVGQWSRWAWLAGKAVQEQQVLQNPLLWSPLPTLQLLPQPQWTLSRSCCGKMRRWGLQEEQPRGGLGTGCHHSPQDHHSGSPSSAPSPIVNPAETSSGIP